MPRFSANLSMLFTECPPIERFAAARAAGFDAVEMQFPYQLSAEAIRRELDTYDLRMVLFNVAAGDLLAGGEGLASAPEKQSQFRAAIAQAVGYARILQPVAINVLPGCCFDPSRKDIYRETFKQNLCRAADAFTPLGVKTMFEAINSIDMPGFIIDTEAKMLAIQDEIKRPDVFLQYDVYHRLMMSENPAAFIAEQAQRIGHIQFADCPGRLHPGTGKAEWSTIFSAIDDFGYGGWTGAEYKTEGNTAATLGWLKRFR